MQERRKMKGSQSQAKKAMFFHVFFLFSSPWKKCQKTSFHTFKYVQRNLQRKSGNYKLWCQIMCEQHIDRVGTCKEWWGKRVFSRVYQFFFSRKCIFCMIIHVGSLSMGCRLCQNTMCKNCMFSVHENPLHCICVPISSPDILNRSHALLNWAHALLNWSPDLLNRAHPLLNWDRFTISFQINCPCAAACY